MRDLKNVFSFDDLLQEAVCYYYSVSAILMTLIASGRMSFT